jgi:DNA-binding LacI/PurR family transcriptional regulator
MIKRTKQVEKNLERVTLKAVAEYVGLAAGTVSSILNRAPQSQAIPQQTRERVFTAARKLRYQPNPYARALRMKRIFSESGQSRLATGSRTLVFEGAENFLRAVDAIRQAGLRVPGDVAILGADDISPISFQRSSSGV